MNWVLGVLRWALFFQAHRDSSLEKPVRVLVPRAEVQCGRPSLTSTVAAALLVRLLGLTPPFFVRPRPRLTSPLLVRFLRLAFTRRELRWRWNVHCAAVPEAKKLVRLRLSRWRVRRRWGDRQGSSRPYTAALLSYLNASSSTTLARERRQAPSSQGHEVAQTARDAMPAARPPWPETRERDASGRRLRVR